MVSHPGETKSQQLSYLDLVANRPEVHNERDVQPGRRPILPRLRHCRIAINASGPPPILATDRQIHPVVGGPLSDGYDRSILSMAMNRVET